jgi:hypothetical protein
MAAIPHSRLILIAFFTPSYAFHVSFIRSGPSRQRDIFIGPHAPVC